MSRATISPENRSLSSAEGRARQLAALAPWADGLTYTEWMDEMIVTRADRLAFAANTQVLVRAGLVELDVRDGEAVYRVKGATC